MKNLISSDFSCWGRQYNPPAPSLRYDNAVGQQRAGILFTILHPLEYVFNVVTEVKTVHPATFLERVHEGEILRGLVTAGEEPCVSPHCDVPEAVLDYVVVYSNKAIMLLSRHTILERTILMGDLILRHKQSAA